MTYDILVIAAGAKTNFFGNDSMRDRVFELKEIGDALAMRNGFIRVLERASAEKDPQTRRRLLTIVIAGGGPTGVEVAGMLAEMNQRIVGTDYPELGDERLEIHLVDGAPTLLTPMSPKSQQAAYDILTRLGVHVHLNELVTLYDDETVYLSGGTTIEASTLIWSAGVVARGFGGLEQESPRKDGRLITDAYNKVVGYENIYAIGDISIQFTDPSYPKGHPQLAQPAKQQGTTLARNLNAVAKGKKMKPFKYFDRGDMAIIGKSYAVADLFKQRVHFGGLLGLLAWLFIHVISLVGKNTKVKTLYNWAIAYLTANSSLRMSFQAKDKRQQFRVPERGPKAMGKGKPVELV